MFGDTRDITDDEIIATLSRTLLPTVVVEGKDDLFLFRRVQQAIGASRISLFPVGGRNRVIYAFQNRPAGSGDVPILFFVDQDEWVFGEIPAELLDDDFFWTEGYSVENDLLRDGDAVGLMEPDERAAYEAERVRFSHWFAVQVARYRRGQAANLAKFAGQVLENQEEYAEECQLGDNERRSRRHSGNDAGR